METTESCYTNFEAELTKLGMGKDAIGYPHCVNWVVWHRYTPLHLGYLDTVLNKYESTLCAFTPKEIVLKRHALHHFKPILRAGF